MEDIKITGQASSGTSSSASAKNDLELAPDEDLKQQIRDRELEDSKHIARIVDGSVGKRKAVPVRKSFVRNDKLDAPAPLAKLVAGGGGRGGAVAVKLYIALIWKCAAAPYDVQLPARKWAQLLALPDAAGRGARRVTNALQVLASLNLVQLDKARGEASRVTLLDESGDGSPYRIPSTAYSRGGLTRDLYFQVSSKLWTSGEFQQLSGPGLTMLLILLAEEGYKQGDSLHAQFASLIDEARVGRDVWFTTENFPIRYGISPATRSRGTRELEDARLLSTRRMPVGPKGQKLTFTTEKVRKVYVLRGNAVIGKDDADGNVTTKPAKRSSQPKQTKPKRKRSVTKRDS